MTIYWGIAVLALSFWVVNEPGDSRYFKSLMFCFFSLASFLIPIKYRRVNVSLLSIILIVLGWICVFPWYHHNMTRKMLYFSIGMISFYNLYSCKHNLNKNLLKDFLALACIGQSLWIIANWLGHDPASWLGIPRKFSNGAKVKPGELKTMIGSLDNIMVSANHLALTFPFLLRRNWCYLIPLVGWAAVLSKSATGVLGVGVATGFYFLYRKWYWQLILLIVLSFAILIPYLPSDFLNGSTRTEAWVKSLIIFTKSDIKHQLFGWGPGIFKYYIRDMLKLSEGNPFSHPHNEYISILFQFGFVGLSWFMFLCGKALRGKDIHFKCALWVLLMSMWSAFPLHIASTALISILILVFLLDFKSDRILRY